MRDETFMKLMRLLPKAALSSAVGAATRVRAPAALHRAAMRAFARRYRVALEDAERGIGEYATFSEFFSRRLKPGLRPIDAGEQVVVSPVDGAVSQIGYAAGSECLQAKGIRFSLEKLVGDAELARIFEGGAFATLYLSPRDYHRIHAPLGGAIVESRYIPGQFWPVNRASVRLKDALFCLNERLVTRMKTRAGTVGVVKVGATCVSRIRASYDQILTHSAEPARARAYDPPIEVQKGEELGAFEMGSTVILLFERGRVRWDPELQPDSVVQMGKRIGELT